MIPDVWTLRFPRAAWVRLFFFSLIGVAPTAVGLTTLFALDVIGFFDLDHSYDPFLLGAMALALIVSIALPMVCLKIRDPGPGKVVLNRWGITEWHGEAVRTAIPWAGSSVFLLERIVHDRRMGSRYSGGVSLSVTNDRGWTINAVWGTTPQIGWRRRITSEMEFSRAAVANFVPQGTQPLPEARFDARDGRRGLFWFSRTVGFFFLASSGGALASLQDLGRNGRDMASLGFTVSALFMVLRTIRPILENVRLSREAVPSSYPFVLQGGDGAFARAVDPHGRQVTLDLSNAPHPDAALATRSTRVHAAIDLHAAQPYPGTPLRVLAIETDYDRLERARIKRANRIEITARVVLVVGMIAMIVILMNNWQVH